MHVYAFALDDGSQVCKVKSCGVSMRDTIPSSLRTARCSSRSRRRVAGPDAGVMLEWSGGVRRLCQLRHSKEENARLREANFELMKKPGNLPAADGVPGRRLRRNRRCRRFRPRSAPASSGLWLRSFIREYERHERSGRGRRTDGHRQYQALLRSRYEHYSPFLNVAIWTPRPGHRAVMDQSRRTAGTTACCWSTTSSAAERCRTGADQHAPGQRQRNGPGTLRGYGEPFCRNIHEPQPGGVGIWTHVLRGTRFPWARNGWLAARRSNGGGSVMTCGGHAGDSFYFVPNHEINAGAAVIAYRMQADGRAHESGSAPVDKLTETEWQAVQQRPWDWTRSACRGWTRAERLARSVPGTEAAAVG